MHELSLAKMTAGMNRLALLTRAEVDKINIEDLQVGDRIPWRIGIGPSLYIHRPNVWPIQSSCFNLTRVRACFFFIRTAKSDSFI